MNPRKQHIEARLKSVKDPQVTNNIVPLNPGLHVIDELRKPKPKMHATHRRVLIGKDG